MGPDLVVRIILHILLNILSDKKDKIDNTNYFVIFIFKIDKFRI